MTGFILPIVMSMTDPLIIVGGIVSGWLWGRSPRNGIIALAVSVAILLIVDVSSAYMLGGRATPRMAGFLVARCAALGLWVVIAFWVARWRAQTGSSKGRP